MRLTTSRARLIRAGILKARSQWGTARVLGENIQDLYGRAYDRTRYRDPELAAAVPGEKPCLPIERKPLEPHGVDLRVAGYADRVAEQQKPFRDASKRMGAELEQLQRDHRTDPFTASLDRMTYLEGAIAHQDRRISELNLDVVNYATRLRP